MKTYIFSDGERYPALIDQDGIPLFYPTLYVTSKLRGQSASLQTMRNQLQDITVLIKWELANGRDLIKEFTSGIFLGTPDVVSLRDFAKQDMRAYEAWGKKNNSSSGKNMRLIEANITSIVPIKSITKIYHYNRMSTLASYIEFLASVLNQHRNDSKVTTEIERMCRTIKNHRPKGLSTYADDPDEKSPPPEIVQEFMEIVSTNHPLNPFKNESIRLRNSIIFDLFKAFGIRLGEILSLRIDKLMLRNSPTFKVERLHDDIFDPRANQPVAKTKARILALERELADKINDYVLNHRSKIPQAVKHPYLFVVHHKGETYGQPLTESSLSNDVIGRMRKVSPKFRVISAHKFRHNANYEFSEFIDKSNEDIKQNPNEEGKIIDDAKERKMRAYLMGHRSERSGEVYNLRHVKKKANEVSLALQKKLRQYKKDEQKE